MVKRRKILIVVISVAMVLSLPGCTIYKYSFNLKPEEVKVHEDIRITAVYTIYGDTLLLDYNSILAVTLSNQEMVFYDKTGEIYSIPTKSVASVDIKYKNVRGSSALNITLQLLLILALSAILVLPLFLILAWA